MANTFAVRFRGYVASKKRHQLQPDEMGPESAEWQVDPILQRLVRRSGSKIIEDTIGSVVGLFETDFDARAEFAGGIHSPSFTTDYSSPCYLYTNETTKKGALGWIDRNQSGSTACHRQLGKEFGSTHYSTAASTVVRMKIPPVWFENSSTPLGRWISTAQRELGAAGSRNWIEVGDRLYLPNAQGTPIWWNKRFNPSTGSGTENTRIFPWGNLMPLNLPRGKLTAAAGTSDNNWKDGDAFFLSVQYEYEDGSLSIPFIPRPAGNVTAGGTTIAAAALGTGGTPTDCRNGQILVGTIGGTSFYKSITWSEIPRGPDGVKFVRLLRSDKVNLASSSVPMTAAPLELHMIVRLPNGADSYIDTGGDNGTLTPDQRITDSLLSIWCPRCQYVIGADSRVVGGGNVQIHPAAIVIAPVGINAFGDVSKGSTGADDSSSLFGSLQAFVNISASTLYLRLVSIPGAPSDVTITITNKTLQEVVDEINEVTAIAGTPTARWGAQLVPGVDGALLATNLADTTGASYFGDDALITSGAVRNGNHRAFGPCYPGILYFSQTYLATLKVDTQGIFMSSASPTVPGGNANSFFSDKSTNWKYPPSATCGRLLGLAPLTGRGGVVCVAYYERARYVLRNTVGGGSGQDADYHLVSLNEHDGCVSHRTVGAGPGVAFACSQLGLSLTDGDSEILISRDIWNAKLQQGDLAAEMLKAIAASSAGNQDHYLSAKFLGSKIALTFRSDTSLTYANRRLEYDFGEGVDSLGIAGMLRQSDTGRPTPYGWSAPNKVQRVSVMGQYADATGTHNFGTNESATGSTGDGRLDEFDTGDTDNAGGYGSAAGANYNGLAYSMLVAPLHAFIRLLSVAMRYGAGHALQITIYTDGPTTQGSRSDNNATLTAAPTGSNLFGDMQSNVPMNVGKLSSTIDFIISDQTAGTAGTYVDAMDALYDVVERKVVS